MEGPIKVSVADDEYVMEVVDDDSLGQGRPARTSHVAKPKQQPRIPNGPVAIHRTDGACTHLPWFVPVEKDSINTAKEDVRER
jgi:hypothetical protein